MLSLIETHPNLKELTGGNVQDANELLREEYAIADDINAAKEELEEDNLMEMDMDDAEEILDEVQEIYEEVEEFEDEIDVLEDEAINDELMLDEEEEYEEMEGDLGEQLEDAQLAEFENLAREEGFEAA